MLVPVPVRAASYPAASGTDPRLLTALDPQGHDNEEAVEAVREVEGLMLLDRLIGRRKAFSNAAAYGRCVLEYTPRDARAFDELQALLQAVFTPVLAS